MPRPGEGLRPVLFNSGLAGAVSLPHRTHFLVLLFLTYVKLSMNSFLPPFRNIPAGVLPESECKGRDFYGFHQTSAHFFYAKKHFFRQKRGRTLLYHARTREERKARKTERGTSEREARSAAAPCGKHASTCRRVLEYFPQSTLPRSARQRSAKGTEGSETQFLHPTPTIMKLQRKCK